MLISAALLAPPTPERPVAVVRLEAELEEGRVVLHDLVVEGGELEHTDRVVLDPTGELPVELSAEVGWSLTGADRVRTWELLVRGLPVREPEVAELERVAVPLTVTADWPTRAIWPALFLPLGLAVALVRRGHLGQ